MLKVSAILECVHLYTADCKGIDFGAIFSSVSNNLNALILANVSAT